MSIVAHLAVRDWWRTLIAHRPLDGVCPECRRRKCQPRAEAFTNLIVTDEWHKGPPPTLDRP